MEQVRRRARRQDGWDRFWKDYEGRVVVWQRPNIWLIIWVVLTLASLFTQGVVASVLWWAALVALAWWSLLELIRGVNYFRRCIGLFVLLLVLAAAFKVGL